MGIFIKGMEMPEKCGDCPFFGLQSAGNGMYYDYCNAYRGLVYDADNSVSMYCPLVEVPTPHGRLKDADELIKHDHQYYEYLSDEFYVLVRDIETPPLL